MGESPTGGAAQGPKVRERATGVAGGNTHRNPSQHVCYCHEEWLNVNLWKLKIAQKIGSFCYSLALAVNYRPGGIRTNWQGGSFGGSGTGCGDRPGGGSIGIGS